MDGVTEKWEDQIRVTLFRTLGFNIHLWDLDGGTKEVDVYEYRSGRNGSGDSLSSVDRSNSLLLTGLRFTTVKKSLFDSIYYGFTKSEREIWFLSLFL